MMISDKMNQQLNAQITHEFNAEKTYLAMSCMFDDLGLVRMNKYFRLQADEEREHALKILDYLNDVGEVTLDAVPKPPKSFESVLAAVEAAVEHEKKVTQQIHDLMTLAISEKDYSTQQFLHWFVEEQVEEVTSMEQLVQVTKMAGPNMLQLDAYVGHLLRERK